MAENDTPIDAAHLFVAALDEKPADVGTIFNDMMQKRVAELAADRREEIAQTMFGRDEEEPPHEEEAEDEIGGDEPGEEEVGGEEDGEEA